MRTNRSAYTLVEMLIVVVLMGLAAAVVIPSLSSASALRVQGAIRTLVADLTTAQSDAVAFQQPRAVLLGFHPGSDITPVLVEAGYALAEFNALGQARVGPGEVLAARYIGGETFGFTQIDLDGSENLPDITLAGGSAGEAQGVIFDALGGPVTSANAGAPAGTQRIRVFDPTQSFIIEVQAFTGRVNVIRE